MKLIIETTNEIKIVYVIKVFRCLLKRITTTNAYIIKINNPVLLPVNIIATTVNTNTIEEMILP